MVANILAGGAAVSVLCRQYGLSLRVVDAGCAGEPFAAHPLFIDRRIRSGSGNIACGAAMTPDEAGRALLAGIELSVKVSKRWSSVKWASAIRRLLQPCSAPCSGLPRRR